MAILERAFVTAHADAEVASFAIAGAVYLIGSTWRPTDVKHFDWELDHDERRDKRSLARGAGRP